ncbi:hypothetical protein A8F94_06745 [Bacillus sp. FJAT-27225]|uniref:hypothetical protein n=1 Tax=Bacillus sp. FJAT-27225 TaxID=1743144 RepID=UPI00080C20F3|nr:hypothetical protein [Bacillus sp. FJAT-27225]OCA87552.1 hypothetical protein A8F94_06745 [Bacillus sp. FJAT-27225]
MKFSIYKAEQNKNSAISKFGTIEASCIDVASDLLFKKLRSSSRPSDGDMFLIVRETGEPLSENFVKDGTGFRVLHYREVD